jgi:hypothetical protein
MAAAAIQTFVYPNAAPRRRPCWTGTPEIYFTKSIDNSRLVKIECFNSAYFRHAKIHQCYIWPVLLELVNGLPAVGSFGDDLQSVNRLEQSYQALTHDMMIVGD